MYPEYGGTREIPSESGTPSPKAILPASIVNQYREGKVKSTPEGVKEIRNRVPTNSQSPLTGDGVPL